MRTVAPQSPGNSKSYSWNKNRQGIHTDLYKKEYMVGGLVGTMSPICPLSPQTQQGAPQIAPVNHAGFRPFDQ